MNHRDPRWLEGELPDELRRVLRSAAPVESSARQLTRIRASLGAAIGPAFSSSGRSDANATGQGAAYGYSQLLSLAKPLGLATLLAAGLGALWIYAPAAPLSSSGSQSTAAGEESLLPALVAAAPSPSTSTPDGHSDPQPSAAGPLQSSDSRPRGGESLVRANENPRASVPGAAKPPLRELGLAEELQQLEIVRREVERSPQRALAAAAVHRQRFPHGALGPERELLRIDALLRLGQYERAQRLADRALTASAANPYRAQVASLIARYARRQNVPTDLPR
jgi:hypothetical protein